MNDHDSHMTRYAIENACTDATLPHVLMRPKIFPDGNKWCCLLGEDLQLGIAGFGDTPQEACYRFDKQFCKASPPPSVNSQQMAIQVDRQHGLESKE